MKIKISMGQFLLFSFLFISCVLSVNQLIELKHQKGQIKEVTKELHEDKDSVYQQVKLIAEKLDDTKMEKEELKDLLNVRYQNYLVATKLEGEDMPLLSRSGFSPEMFEQAWDEYGAVELKGSGKEFVKAEEKTGVNALTLAAISAHETNWGKSSLALQNNNFFGWGAFDHSPYESAANFDSRKESILHVAESLRDNYLSRDGRYHEGENLHAVNERYASDEQWAEKVSAVMKNIAKVSMEDPEEIKDYLEEEFISVRLPGN